MILGGTETRPVVGIYRGGQGPNPCRPNPQFERGSVLEHRPPQSREPSGGSSESPKALYGPLVDSRKRSAMAVGVTAHVWSVAELLEAALEAECPN